MAYWINYVTLDTYYKFSQNYTLYTISTKRRIVWGNYFYYYRSCVWSLLALVSSCSRKILYFGWRQVAQCINILENY